MCSCTHVRRRRKEPRASRVQRLYFRSDICRRLTCDLPENLLLTMRLRERGCGAAKRTCFIPIIDFPPWLTEDVAGDRSNRLLEGKPSNGAPNYGTQLRECHQRQGDRSRNIYGRWRVLKCKDILIETSGNQSYKNCAHAEGIYGSSATVEQGS